MLEKNIIHLKNIIFLKAVIYSIIIIGLLFLLPSFNEELESSFKIHEKAIKTYNETELKLYSIIGSEEKILETYKKYEKILQQSEQENCNKRIKIAQDIIKLQNKHKLLKPLYIGFFSPFNKEQLAKNLDPVTIKLYDLNIAYSSPSINSAINILKDSFYLMPEHTIISSYELTNKEALTYNIINELKPAQKPELIKSKVVMRIRSLAANIVN